MVGVVGSNPIAPTTGFRGVGLASAGCARARLRRPARLFPPIAASRIPRRKGRCFGSGESTQCADRQWRTPIKRSAAKTQTNNRAVLNDDIRAFRVRLIGASGAQVGIVERDDALREARREGLDLVLIAPDAEPPVVKVMDYGKHLFDQKKAKAAQRKKQKQTQVKEMKFRPGTEEGDYQVKLRNLVRFLEDGDKAKVVLRFRGREMVHPEIGATLLKRIEGDLDELASVETQPKFEGRQMTMVFAPRRKGR